MTRLLTVAIVAGMVRAAVVCGGSYLLSETSDWRQLLGYWLALLGLPEILLTRGLRSDFSLWAIASSLVLIAGTVMWISAGASILRRYGVSAIWIEGEHR